MVIPYISTADIYVVSRRVLATSSERDLDVGLCKNVILACYPFSKRVANFMTSSRYG